MNFKQGDSFGNNFNNGDEALFQDANLPRDSFGFKIRNGIQTSKLDFGSGVSGFYLDQITAIGGKEITGINTLAPEIIPLGSGTTGYSNLPFSNYGLSFEQAKESKGSSYSRGNLMWRYSKNGGIIIPSAGSYIIKYYSEVYFDPSMGQSTFLVALTNGNGGIYDYFSKVIATNPDVAGNITIQDFKSGEELYLAGMHASPGGKKALYLGTIIIFKLS